MPGPFALWKTPSFATDVAHLASQTRDAIAPAIAITITITITTASSITRRLEAGRRPSADPRTRPTQIAKQTTRRPVLSAPKQPRLQYRTPQPSFWDAAAGPSTSTAPAISPPTSQRTRNRAAHLYEIQVRAPSRAIQDLWRREEAKRTGRPEPRHHGLEIGLEHLLDPDLLSYRTCPFTIHHSPPGPLSRERASARRLRARAGETRVVTKTKTTTTKRTAPHHRQAAAANELRGSRTLPLCRLNHPQIPLKRANTGLPTTPQSPVGASAVCMRSARIQRSRIADEPAQQPGLEESIFTPIRLKRVPSPHHHASSVVVSVQDARHSRRQLCRTAPSDPAS
ncbi:hypothetical protein CC80DRAFT_544036 [Byssothecium circinans]|uniref:Uncharacterized protein n=1 Tax=Byssothecium circinans TaxID=147558 RepID=A0A6A5U8F6_9PLEO|nr:hypothetical protein CC80DRAFT_544036 [Byssothecium circinans]